MEGDVDKVREILAHHPSQVNLRDDFMGSTPLIFATHRGFRDVVEVLLHAGADVHARERISDTTPLHWAGEGGHREIVQMLVDHGAMLDVVDGWYKLGPVGWGTVVSWAPQFHEDRPATVELLLSLGAPLDPFSAIVRDDEMALREMVEADPSLLHERLGFAAQEQQPLHFAAMRGKTELVNLLLDLGADIEALTMSGVSALGAALSADHVGTADALRNAGAPLDLSAALVSGEIERARTLPFDERHKFLLHACAAAGVTEGVALLLERGADVRAEAPRLLSEMPSSVTPLHLAALNGHAEAAEVLLENGAPVDAPAKSTLQTPLHCAASNGHIDVARVLLAFGADRYARDSQYDSVPSGFAQFGGHAELAALLSV